MASCLLFGIQIKLDPSLILGDRYLNVWAPANVTKPLPVMVFFPGGNYRQDAASTDLYWGKYLFLFLFLFKTLAICYSTNIPI